MLIAFTEERFPEEYVPTLCDQGERDVAVDGRSVRLSYWDTAGHEYDRLRLLWHAGTSVYLLCVSVVSATSREHVVSKVPRGARARLRCSHSQWLPEARHHCPEARLLLVGTKRDLRKDPEALERLAQRGETPLTQEQLAKLARDIGAVRYMECSAMTGEGVGRVFEEAARVGSMAMDTGDARVADGVKCVVH